MSNQELSSTTTTTTTVITNSDCRRTIAVDALTTGRESAMDLRDYLLYGTGSENIIPHLLDKITSSFDDAIMALNCGDRSGEFSPKSEDSGESSKHTPLAVRKGRRGCYKRRKGSQYWTVEAMALADDGHAWRKYGQKVILNAPFPRSYFRCTHKKEQNCQATKQVQMTQSDPPMYTITYDGLHTCSSLLNAQTLFVDSAPTAKESCSLMLSFDSAAPEPNQSPLFVGSPPSSSYNNMFSRPDFAAFEGMASNESSNCSNLDGVEFMPHHQDGIGMSFDDFEDVMKLEFDY